MVVTTRADQPYTEFAEALGEVCGAVQLTVVDPQWGRDELLWPLLEQFLTTTAVKGISR